MATYLELKQQAEQLLAQAEELRAREKAQAISDIKAKIAAYGLTAQDLGLAGRTAARETPGARRKPAEMQFRGPHGELWSGRGRQPAWIVSALAAGKSLDDFRT